MVFGDLTTQLLGTLGTTLLHFLWQGTAVALVYAASLAVIPARDARTRYALGIGALVAMAVWPACTFAALWGGGAAVAMAAVAPAGGELALGITGWIALAWFAGALARATRLAAGWRAVRTLRSEGCHPAADAVQAAARTMGNAMGLPRPVALLESGRVAVPTVVGWVRPAILLPVGLAAGLTPRQLELILAHELAHVRRHDFLINLLQNGLETALFFHPAVWWVSRRVRLERECCCDDLAAQACGDRVALARALAALAALRATPALAVGATGGSLVLRVRRLIGASPAPRRSRGPWLAMGGLAVALAATQVPACSGPPVAASPVADAGDRDAETASAAPTVGTVDEPVSPELDFHYNPIGKRDPFRSYTSWVADPAIGVALGPLGKWELDQLRLVGILEDDGGAAALVETPTGEGHVVHTGTPVGRRHGLVTHIGEDGLVVTQQRMEPERGVWIPVETTLPMPDQG